jgi:aldose 1-epimerase
MSTPDALTLRAGKAYAQVLPSLGGALACFDWAGAPVLRPLMPGQTQVRQSACFPLVPFSNRVSRGSFRFAGQTVLLPTNADHSPHPIHGVGWQSCWNVVATSASQASLVLDYCPQETSPAWPFAFRAEQTVRLFAQGMELELAIENRDQRMQPVGLGWHPYFPRGAGMRLTAAVVGMWQADAERLPLRQALLQDPLPTGVEVAKLDYDHCFFGFSGTARIEWPERGLAVTLRADPALAHLVLYTPPDRPFIAVEPVSHMNDAFNRSDLWRDHGDRPGFDPFTGLRVLSPGERFACRIQLLPEEI